MTPGEAATSPAASVNVPGLPEGLDQRVVRADLFRQPPDVAETDAELIVAGTISGIVRARLRVAESLELLESFRESWLRALTKDLTAFGVAGACHPVEQDEARFGHQRCHPEGVQPGPRHRR